MLSICYPRPFLYLYPITNSPDNTTLEHLFLALWHTVILFQLIFREFADLSLENRALKDVIEKSFKTSLRVLVTHLITTFGLLQCRRQC
ncbi:hypothetical protein F9L48_22565 [Escherichia coli]|nr:hypothetical protein [Escherichia coli]EFB5266146.1 hypothetical protein [Escherichia coli]EFE7354952.1 hypothetical protein [Escherichia coli]EFF1044500.1 hypothetical protein [Escherichia coli]EFH9012072.1 hypothetical protein [Escherichia coli]